MFSVFEWFVLVLQCDAFVVNIWLINQDRTKGEGWSTANKLKPPVILLLADTRRLLCFGSFVVLVVVCGYVLLF